LRRLEAYDKNFNFDNTSCTAHDYKMTLPAPDMYKDISTDSQVKCYYNYYYVCVS